MTNIAYGVLSGTALGVLAIGPMFKMTFADKQSAIVAAFIDRFAIGLVVSLVSLPWPGWVVGLVFGVLLSLPSALITKARVPILIVGAVGGLLIGAILPYAVRAAP
jgi:hypothetical protein